MHIESFTKLAQVVAALVKDAQEAPAARGPVPKRKTDLLRGAYPDYGKSLFSQTKKDPTTAGVVRGAQTGATGAILAALIARMVSDKASTIGMAAGAGALAAGVPGYISGKREAESDSTKLLALRRLGINNPAERMIMQNTQILAPRMTRPGETL